MNETNVQRIDLRNPKTFRGENLTERQMNQRYTILSELEETLDAEGKPLSPRSTKELKELVDLVTRSKREILEGSFPICRLIAPHYWVVFPSPEGRKIAKYKEIGEHLEEIPQSERGVLLAVQKVSDRNWFNEAIKMQGEVVLISDFMDSLRYSYIANICLLRSSALLTKEAKIFKEVLTIYKHSANLYEDQIAFNRSVENNLLKSAESSHKNLRNFHEEILQICGNTLQQNDQIFTRCSELHNDQTQLALNLSTQLEEHCAKFLTKIEDLKGQVTTCINNISSQNVNVQDALSRMNILLMKRQQLKEKKDSDLQKLNEKVASDRQKLKEKIDSQCQQLHQKIDSHRQQINQKDQRVREEFDRFQAQKRAEDASRREERVGGTNVSFLGIPIFSQEPTIKIHEANFGSNETRQTYLQLSHESAQLENQLLKERQDLENQFSQERQETERKFAQEREAMEQKFAQEQGALDQEITNAKNTLAQTMLDNGVAQYGTDQKSMEKAISYLTSATAALTQFEIGLNIRRSQAQKQIGVCKKELGIERFVSMPQILRYLEDSMARIVQIKSLWIESNRGSVTIQECRRLEQGIQVKLINALSTSANDPNALEGIANDLAAYLPNTEQNPDELFQQKLISYEGLLLKYTQNEV